MHDQDEIQSKRKSIIFCLLLNDGFNDNIVAKQNKVYQPDIKLMTLIYI